MSRKEVNGKTIMTIGLSVLLVLTVVAMIVSLSGPELPQPTPMPTPNPDKQYILKYEGTEYGTEEELKAELPETGAVKFGVSGTDSYTVKIVSGIDSTQSGTVKNLYYVDGAPCIFGTDDYTEEFDMTTSKGEITINCTAGYYDLTSVLQRRYPGKEITYYRGITEDEYPFKMVVTSSEGSEIKVLLRQKG